MSADDQLDAYLDAQWREFWTTNFTVGELAGVGILHEALARNDHDPRLLNDNNEFSKRVWTRYAAHYRDECGFENIKFFRAPGDVTAWDMALAKEDQYGMLNQVRRAHYDEEDDGA